MTNRQRGQSIVEFALVLPVFLLLLVGLIDFSRLLFTYVSLSNGTREFARVAAVSTSQSLTAVNAFNNLTLFGGAVDPTTDSLTITAGNAACARALDTGTACAGGTSTTVTCTLPLNPPGACALPARTQDGIIQVTATHTFRFNPLFQSSLAGVTHISFIRQITVLTTTVRVFVE